MSLHNARRVARTKRWNRINFVNSVYRSRVQNKVDLREFCKKHKNAVLYERQPQMVKIKSKNITLIVFESGKFRLMGPQTVGEAYRLAKKYFDKFGPLEWQTSTVVLDLKRRINLAKLYEHERVGTNKFIYYESELFPALTLNRFGSCHVNVFASGKVVITGIKRTNFMCCHDVYDHLYTTLQKY
jgi:TATA-box binding protein (TBP) (component of TFIID and TFIIIB)